MISDKDENAQIVAGGIQQARVLLAQKSGSKNSAGASFAAENNKDKSLKPGQEAVSGTVVLSASLRSAASPDDTLFVLVRAAEGSKMPLAIVRKQVKDLPFKFTLDDTTAMSPQMKMSNFDQLVVIARVSKSGNAMTQAGDLHGMSSTIKPGSRGLNIIIDKVAE